MTTSYDLDISERMMEPLRKKFKYSRKRDGFEVEEVLERFILMLRQTIMKLSSTVLQHPKKMRAHFFCSNPQKRSSPITFLYLQKQIYYQF